MATMGRFYNPQRPRLALRRHWINSTTISARRQLVDYIFAILNEETNGNEKRDLSAARELDEATSSSLTRKQVLSLATDDLANHLTTYFTEPSRANYSKSLKKIIGDTSSDGAVRRVRSAIIALLQSPAYNLS